MKKVSMKKNWDNPRENSMPASARVPASVEIGGVLVAPATVLAPMAGVTDTVFRRFIRNASIFTGSGNGDAALHRAGTWWRRRSAISNPAAG
jgi:tRNA-dihydrouridine synthase B